jgi:hypothetical protein
VKEMKNRNLLIAIVFIACNTGSGDTPRPQSEIPQDRHDSGLAKKDSTLNERRSYGNDRFRNVTVSKQGKGTYAIEGQAQIFEANFGWLVNKGEEEVLSGFESTDAGAPSWGNFTFTLEIEQKHLSSPLVLVLYESSARDGSRQHQLNLALQ